MVALIYIPSNSDKGSCFVASSPTFVVVYILDDSHANWGGMKSKCNFDLHFFYGQGN
jgi:hypothetical protein